MTIFHHYSELLSKNRKYIKDELGILEAIILPALLETYSEHVVKDSLYVDSQNGRGWCRLSTKRFLRKFDIFPKFLKDTVFILHAKHFVDARQRDDDSPMYYRFIEENEAKLQALEREMAEIL